MTLAGFPIASTTNHDLQLDATGNLLIVTGLEGLRQRVLERLLFWVGEWFLNAPDGVDYREEIFQRPISSGLAAAEISEQIRSVEGVDNVSRVTASIDPDTRRFHYSATVHSSFGDTEVNIGDN